MDPNAVLKQLDQALQADTHNDLVDGWVTDLRKWIAKGGFEPDWNAYPLATGYFMLARQPGAIEPGDRFDGLS